jgi:sugar phosphate isomerase/epimerase
MGVSSLELTFPSQPDASEFFSFAGELLARGLDLSFHMPYADVLDLREFAEGAGPVGDYFRRWMAHAARLDFAGRAPVLVFHGVNAPGTDPVTRRQALATSAAFLRWLPEVLKRGGVPVLPAFEVRPYPADSVKTGSTCAEVLAVLSEADVGEAGVCWDVGHTMLNALRGTDVWPPPSPFVARTVHVHLHLADVDGDHRPILGPDPYLQEAFELLGGVRYSGSLTLESSFRDWSEVVPSVSVARELAREAGLMR